jgi:cytochrome c556
LVKRVTSQENFRANPEKNLICLSAIAIGLSAAAMAHSGATGIIKERMDFLKRSKDNMKAINMHLRGGDYRAIVPLAEDIRDWAGKMPDYFPQGSDGKPSEAAPEIWTDFDGFTQAAKDHYEAVDTLVSAAKPGMQAISPRRSKPPQRPVRAVINPIG